MCYKVYRNVDANLVVMFGLLHHSQVKLCQISLFAFIYWPFFIIMELEINLTKAAKRTDLIGVVLILDPISIKKSS